MSRQSKAETRSILRVIGLSIGLATLVVSYAKAHGEDLPDAPQPHVKAILHGYTPALPRHMAIPFMTKTEMADASGVITANVLDWYTTQRFLAHGGKEGILPQGFVENSGGFLAFKLAVSAGQIAAEHYVDRTRYAQKHRWFRYTAQGAQQVAIALIVHQDVKNWQYANRLERMPASNPGTPIGPITPTRPPFTFAGGK